jgi:hypothetical protein
MLLAHGASLAKAPLWTAVPQTQVPVALATLLSGIGLVALLVLSI